MGVKKAELIDKYDKIALSLLVPRQHQLKLGYFDLASYDTLDACQAFLLDPCIVQISIV